MAVVYRGKHHRNPSGRNNKVKWLLSVSKWNPREMERVVTNVVRETKNKDWYVILALAELLRLHAIDLDRQIITDLKEYLKRHKDCPHYIEDDISSILSYIKESDYSLEVTNDKRTENN